MNVVIIGAGKIGRGFVGRLFSQSGYELVVVEIDQPLIDALNRRHAYTVHLVDADAAQSVEVGPVRAALHAGDQRAVARAIAETNVLATSVGARALPEVAPNIAAGVRQRIDLGIESPLNCLICENLYQGGDVVRELVRQHLAAGEQAYLNAHVGFVDTVIGCVGPPIPPDLRARDASAVLAEPYQELPIDRQKLVGPAPAVKGLEASDHFAVYGARKLYIHNCAHAALAYLGHLKGYTWAHDAAVDADILAHLRALWRESSAGLIAAYGVEPGWLEDLIAGLPRRFANRALGDTILRLGRDPARKLGPTDRLVAPARLAERAGATPHALSRAIAAALCFDPPQDPLAVELQQRLDREGLDAVLADVCHIQPGEALAGLIRQTYVDLKRTRVLYTDPVNLKNARG